MNDKKEGEAKVFGCLPGGAVGEAGMPLENSCPALYERLKAAYELERSDDLKAEIQKILNGGIHFPEE